MPTDSFWERPEIVDRFAEREPDRRLLALIEEYQEPGRVRVLDLGCAGGRNAELLAQRGFDVHAVDASEAMVARTRERLEEVLGPADARLRVRRRPMHDLRLFPDASFDLVVALGIYHNATSWEEWRAALAETARVLVSGGLLLTASFAPGTDLTGAGTTVVEDEPHVFEGFPSGRAVLLTAEELARAVEPFGLRPTESSETVRVETEDGRRITVNALFGKRPSSDS